MRRWGTLAIVLAAGGCGGETSYAPPVKPASATVRGIVRWKGARPAIIDHFGDFPADLVRVWGADHPPDERFELSPDGGMPHAFVWAAAGPHRDRKWPVPAEPCELRVVAAVYRPHVFGLMATQPLRISTTDERAYSPHVVRRGPAATGAAAGGLPFTTTFTAQTGHVVLEDDIYSWMTAHAFVLDHPFFATTDADGRFKIRGLPPGDYTVKVWHESLAADRPSGIERETAISLRAAEIGDLDVDLR